MKRLNTLFLLVIVVLLTGSVVLADGAAKSTPGLKTSKTEYHFTLKGIKGKTWDSRDFFKENKWVIYYFFDIESNVCRDGLTFFNQIRDQYTADVSIYGITAFDSDMLRKFTNNSEFSIPILMDMSEVVAENYGALSIFPTTIVVNQDNKIVEEIVGTSGTVQSVITAVIDRHILKGRPEEATKLLATSEIQEEIKKDSGAYDKASAAKGYAFLKTGDIGKAKKSFGEVRNQIIKMEGEAALSYQNVDNGQTEKLIKKLLSSSPNNTYAHTLKAKLLFKEGKVKEAILEYEKAVDGDPTFPWQKAEAANNMGRALAKMDKPSAALTSYNRSLSIYPDNVMPLSNKGVTLNKTGNYKEAAKVLDKASKILPKDPTIILLKEKNAEDIVFSKDIEKQMYIRKLVDRLVMKYEEQQKNVPKKVNSDDWTSRPLSMSFLPFKIEGDDPERDGDAIILYQAMQNSLQGLERTHLVERRVIDKLLEELELGSSDLANKNNQLKLGKILAARLLLASNIQRGSNNQYYVTLRVIDTETSEVIGSSKAVLPGINQAQSVEVMTAGTIPNLLATKYPFKCKIVLDEGKQAVVNIGSDTGVFEGVLLEVIEQGKPIIFQGETLGFKTSKIATMDIINVQEKMSYARINDKVGELKPGMLCRER